MNAIRRTLVAGLAALAIATGLAATAGLTADHFSSAVAYTSTPVGPSDTPWESHTP